jgi:ParB/RepB/Spo0J family partition protein
MQFEQIRCVDIRPDPDSGGYQAHEVAPLAESIRAFGFLRPVLVRPSADGYVIVHGERRWRAAQMLGLEAIPAVLVKDLRDVADMTSAREPARPSLAADLIHREPEPWGAEWE